MRVHLCRDGGERVADQHPSTDGEPRLWADRDFLKFWAGETVSLLGSQVTLLAIPLTAILLLDAGPAELGVLAAAGFAPFLLLTLIAGVWVDRWPRRPIMLVTNLGRGLLLGVIPVLAVQGVLELWHLIVTAFAVACCQVFFELAYQSYIPSLVGAPRLIEANAKLQTSAAAADVAGPGAAGFLIQAVGAPVAIVLDSISFLFSALVIGLIRQPEPRPTDSVDRDESMWRQIRSGLRLVLGNPYLRGMAGEATTFNLGSTILETVLLLYAVEELGLGAGLIGLIFSIGALGALLGAVLAERAQRRFRFGFAMVGAYLFACLPPLLIPLAAPPVAVAVPILAVSYFLGGIGLASSQIYVYSLRQTITPDHMLGRMNSGYRFFVTGMLPIAALLAGILGEQIGLRATLLVGSLITLGAMAWILASPIGRIRDLGSVAHVTG
jgi:MFS family permease